MDEQVLAVELYGARVGTLARRPGGGVRFQPEREWVSRRFKPRLGLGWDLHPEHGGRRSSSVFLPAWFENLLPEARSALRQRVAQALGISPQRSFSLLAALGRDLPGAVVVRADPSIERAHGDAEEAEGPTDDATSHDAGDVEGFSSLGGMQLKFSVSIRDEKVVLPLKGQDGDWLIKLTTGDYPELAEVEHVTMDWAARSGFEVPEHRLARVKDVEPYAHLASTTEEHAFLIRRFDRSADGRIHQEDFAQVLEIMPDDKYAERGRVQTNHQGMARIVLDACGERDLRRYIERLVFVIISGNTDAHFKNWSILHPRDERPRLTPLYDQVATIAWRPYGWENDKYAPRLSLGLGKSRWFSDLDLDSFHSMARRVHMREEDMDRIVQETIERCYSTWPAIEQAAPERMRKALALHANRVPLLRRFSHRLKP